MQRESVIISIEKIKIFLNLKILRKHRRAFSISHFIFSLHRIAFSLFKSVPLLFPTRFHGDKSNSTFKSTLLKSTSNPWSNSIRASSGRTYRVGDSWSLDISGYPFGVPRTMVHRIHPRERSPSNPRRTEQDECGREREGDAGERSRKEGDPARGGRMKIFLGMPKTETRAGLFLLLEKGRRRSSV